MCALRQPDSPLAAKGVVFIMSKAGKKSSRTAIQKEPRGERAGGMESKSESRITQPGPQSYLPRWRSGVGVAVSSPPHPLVFLQCTLNMLGKYQRSCLSFDEDVEYEV